MVPFFRRLSPGETPTAADWNKLVDSLDSLRRPIAAGGGLNAFLSVMGPQIRDYSLQPHFAQIGEQAYTPNKAFAALDNYSHKEYLVELDGTGNTLSAPIGVEGFVDVDSGTATDSFFPAVEVNGRIDVPESYIGQLTPHRSGNYFQFEYTPQTIIRACLAGESYVDKEDMNVGTSNSYSYKLAETYTQLPGQAGRALLAVGFANASVQAAAGQSFDDDVYFSGHIGIVSDLYDADDPTSATTDGQVARNTSLMFAYQSRDGTTESDVIAAWTKGFKIYIIDGNDPPNITGDYIEFDNDVTATFKRDNQVGSLWGSAVCHQLVEYPQSAYGMPYRGRYPANVYTRFTLWFYLSTNYTGDFSVTFTGGSSQFPTVGYNSGSQEHSFHDPTLIIIQVSTDDPMLLCDAPSFINSLSLDTENNSQFLIAPGPL